MAGAIGTRLEPAAVRVARRAPARAVAFDAFVLFDPRPFPRALEQALPGRGADVAAAFRTRLFEYGWLRVLGGRYVDFAAIADHALDAALEQEQVRFAAAERRELLDVFFSLPPWPDAVASVRDLASRGLALAVLSNWSPAMLASGLERAGLADVVDPISTDTLRTYKPDPRAYALAPAKFAVPPEAVRFVAFASWDAAGASWAGLPAIWMNRTGAIAERLDAGGVRTATSFAELDLS